MNSNIILPMELINKILIMRPTHPTAKLLKTSMKEYINIYEDEINYISYKIYLNEGGLTTNNDISHLFYLYAEYDIKLKRKNNNNKLRCHKCGLYFMEHHLYLHCLNRDIINCISCFKKNLQYVIN